MTRQITQQIRIAAPAQTVWAATTAVTRWPDWASTITSVHQAEGNGLHLGALLQQAALWEVTDLIAVKRFSWRSERRFLTWVACHDLDDPVPPQWFL
ncbi:MAG: SRPBCC family protein [Pseudorhodobacter sp.]